MSLVKIAFSPTGGTSQIVECLRPVWGGLDFAYDLCDGSYNFENIKLCEDDLCLIAVPCFAGRVPQAATERLSKINGNNAKAVLIVSYGNRAYEDALAELYDVATDCNFKVVAGITAIAKHSIMTQFASDRPNSSDRKELVSFGEQIIQAIREGKTLAKENVPGNRPYKTYNKSSLVPMATNGCNNCGYCSTVCPVQAIDHDDCKKVDGSLCIGCMRCVAVCPQKARKVKPEMIQMLTERVGEFCKGYKENELFL